MRTNTPYGALVVALLLVTTSSFSCGLGTEVGNGRKPSQDDGELGNQPESTDAPTTTTEMSQPDTVKPQSGTNSPDEIIPLSSASLDLLFNSCATPLADKLASPLSLVQQKTSASSEARHIRAILSADSSSWSVSEADNLLYTVTPDKSSAPFAAKIENTKQLSVNLEPSCDEVEETLDVVLAATSSKQTKMSVKLTVEDRVFELVWFKTPGTSPAAESTLTRIEVMEIARGEATVWIAAP